jgi:20S proteasome alpha/beta subunit
MLRDTMSNLGDIRQAPSFHAAIPGRRTEAADMTTARDCRYKQRSTRNFWRMLDNHFMVFCYLLLLFQQSSLTGASQAAGLETLVGIVGKDFVVLMADSGASQSIALTASNLDKIATLSDPFPYGGGGPPVHQRLRQMPVAAAAAGDAADSDRLIMLLQKYATMEEYQNGWGCDVEVVACSKNNQPGIVSTSRPGLDVDAMAHFARRIIAEGMRSSPFQVCLLIAGMQYTNEEVNESGDALQEVSDQGYSNKATKRFPSHLLQRQTQQAWGVLSNNGDEPEENEANKDSPPNFAPIIVNAPFSRRGRYEPRLYWLDEYGSLQQVQYGAHGMGANFLLSILDRGYRDDMSLEEAVALAQDCFRELRIRYLVNSPQPPCLKCIDASGIRLLPQDDVAIKRKD